MLNCLFRTGARTASVIETRANWALRDGSMKKRKRSYATRHLKRWIESLSLRAPCDFSSTRHLIKAEEILGLRLITLHNLHFYLNLMRQARAAIENETFNEFRSNLVANYKGRGLDLIPS